MGPFDRPVGRESSFPYGRPNEAPIEGANPDTSGLLEEDPLVPARGAVNGVLWGAILWAVILWVLL